MFRSINYLESDDYSKKDQHLFNLTFERSPVAMLIINENRLIDNINHSALKMLGIRLEQAMGKANGEVFRCSKLEHGGICGEMDGCQNCPIRSRINGSFDSNKSFFKEKDHIVSIDMQGVMHILHLNISTTKIPFKESNKVLLCLEDVTELENARQQLQSYNSDLQYLKSIQHAIIRSSSKESFLKNIFEVINLHPKVKYSWISVFSNENKLISFESSGNQKLDEKLKKSFSDNKNSIPPCIRLVQENNEPTLIESTNSRFSKMGIFRVFPDSNSFCLPLSNQDQNYGYLSVILSKNGNHNSLQLLIESVAKDIAFKLQYLNNKEKLIAASIAAESANRAKDDFLAVMSHELLTPLNPINGYASLLKSETESKKTTEYVNGIIESSNRLSQLVNNVLELINLQNNKIIHVENETNIYDEIIRLKNNNLSGDQSRLLTILNPIEGTQEVTSDEIYLCNSNVVISVLSKLMDNAVKFTKSGFIEIGVGYNNRNKILEFHLLDSGIGIPAEKQKMIFQKFSSVDSSNTRTHEGAGIGLSICKHYMALVNGEIGFDSEEGKGSRFWFKIPATQIIDASLAASGMDLFSDETNFSETRKALIVDDSTMNRKVLCQILKQLGFKPDKAQDGQIGLELCNSNKYDLILMDIHMPFMNGEQLSKMIRMGYGKNADTPIIGVTADISPELKKRCMESEFNGWQNKPINYSNFSEEIKRVLNKHRSFK